MPSLVAAAAANVVMWAVTYTVLSRRISTSPFTYFYGLAVMSAIGAAVLSDSFSLPDGDYIYVVVVPLVLTVVITVRSAMRPRSSTSKQAD